MATADETVGAARNAAPFAPEATPLGRVVQVLVRAIAVAFSLFQIYAAYAALDPIMVRVAHVTFGFMLIFLVYGPRGRMRPRLLSFDGILLAACVLLIAIYVVQNFHKRAFEVGAEPPILDLICGTALIVLILDGARRVAGLGFTLLTIFVLFYARFGEIFPGVLMHRDYDYERIVTGLFMTTEGVFGQLTGISASFVFVFVLFGAMLRFSGAGDFFIEFASSVFGHVRGGPAKIAVVGSSLFAMISSSGLANAAASGQMTIPLMKKAGYRSHFAAGVEAVASEAGVITPPVMGGTVFIMMEILSISYASIMAAVALTAVLYYFALFLMVDLEAARFGLRGLPRNELPRVWQTLRSGWHFLIPPLVLLYFLAIEQTSPMRAAFWAIIAIPLATWIRPSRGMGPRQLLLALADGAIAALPLIGVLVCANIMIGIVGLTGVGLMVSGMLVSLSGNSTIALLGLTAVATIILGMGLPAIAAYVVLVVTVAPALTISGIDPLSAHLFIFYFAMISQITPPIAPTAFVTANIAGASFMRTAFVACRLALVIAVLPFLLVYNPELTMRGDVQPIVLGVVTAGAGTFFLAATLQGYLVGLAPVAIRAMTLIAAAGLLVPDWRTDLIGLAAGGFALLWQIMRARRPLLADARSEGSVQGSRARD